MRVSPWSIAKKWVGDFEHEHSANGQDYCWRCGVNMPSEGVTEYGCAYCKNEKLVWDATYRFSDYKKPVKDWVIELKYKKIWGWSQYLGDKLGQDIISHPRYTAHQKTIVCSVPLYFYRRWNRGFNQAEEIARKMAKTMGKEYLALLKRTRSTKKQALITSKIERLANVKGAFKGMHCDLTGYHIYLVDDVMRTGATMTECAKVLRKMGADKIYATVVAVAGSKNQKLQSK